MAEKKSIKKKTKSLNDHYNEVAAKANKEGVSVNVAETKRVLACFFDELEGCPAASMDCDEPVGEYESNFVHGCHYRYLAMCVSGGNRIGVAIKANQ